MIKTENVSFLSTKNKLWPLFPLITYHNICKLRTKHEIGIEFPPDAPNIVWTKQFAKSDPE